MPTRGKILVIRGGAIGDFILTFPVLSALRAEFPEAHLEVLGYPHIADLAVAGGLVQRARSIEAQPLARFFARGGELSDELCEYFSSFDIIISYLYDPDKIFQINVASCSRAQFIAGPHRPDEKQKVHATKVFLQPLERLAIFEAEEIPKLSLKGIASSDKQLAFHPGSGSERKNWPANFWAELIETTLAETDHPILLVGGEAESSRLDFLGRSIPRERLDIAENLALVDLAVRLQSCAGFVGHDSGISHLAAALGLPGLVLWGDTVEEIWRPPSAKIKILRSASGLAGLSVARVANELKQLFG
ncbi:MAG: glycosyltransferase family 9 protein [Verrucomicrobiota bacterium]